jgi:uncharacterized protein YeeX (DUF496 family)|tara:strand:+ start:790 stop:1011 length:222 start_codon:yes stop_codon:yes gene_type:complete
MVGINMDYEPIDVYRNDVKERLVRIETILNRELPDIKHQLKALNGRTRSLENWRNYIIGGMAILTTIITWSFK